MKLALGVSLGALLGILTTLHASPLPEASAQAAAPGDAAASGGVILGIGGVTNNQNDVCWVLFREKARDRHNREYERTSLCLYKATGNGSTATFDLADAREITYDGKLSQLNARAHKAEFAPQVLKDAYEKAKEREERERNANNSTPRSNP